MLDEVLERLVAQPRERLLPVHRLAQAQEPGFRRERREKARERRPDAGRAVAGEAPAGIPERRLHRTCATLSSVAVDGRLPGRSVRAIQPEPRPSGRGGLRPARGRRRGRKHPDSGRYGLDLGGAAGRRRGDQPALPGGALTLVLKPRVLQGGLFVLIAFAAGPRRRLPAPHPRDRRVAGRVHPRRVAVDPRRRARLLRPGEDPALAPPAHAVGGGPPPGSGHQPDRRRAPQLRRRHDHRRVVPRVAVAGRGDGRRRGTPRDPAGARRLRDPDPCRPQAPAGAP